MEAPSTNLESLRPVPRYNPIGSNEKTVHKMTDGTRLLAVKLFLEKEVDSGLPIDKQARSKAEYEAYRLLRTTALKPYIPEPYCLIKDKNKNPIGLAVEWRDGKLLSSMLGQKPLTMLDFDELERALLALKRLTHKGLPVYPSTELWSGDNLMVKPHGYPRIWIAECAVENAWTFDKPLDWVVKNDLLQLRKQFATP